MNTPIYLILLFGHIISLIVGFGAVIVVDTFGLLWLLKWWGVDLGLVRRVAVITQRLIWVGFTGLVLTGLPMIIMKGAVSDLTKIKLFLVLMVGLNGIFLHTIKKSLDALGDNIIAVPARIYFRISLASGISQLGWWGATAIGFYNREVGVPMAWSEYYVPVIGLIVFVIGITWTVGELIVARRP
jgi:hypothetical protein